MPACNGAVAFTITAYRYQDGGASETKYYEVDEKVDVWAMTKLANNA